MPSLIDANVPIYAAGGEHPYKEPCSRIMVTVAAHPRFFVTDVEVFQDVMHRYLASRQWATGGGDVLQRFVGLMRGRAEPIYATDIEVAAVLADRYPGIGARDFIHAAVMRRLGVEHIISADRDFDRLPGVVRLDPADVDAWEASVLSA